jgi:hypothetical protein
MDIAARPQLIGNGERMRAEEIAKGELAWFVLSYVTRRSFIAAAVVHAFGPADAVHQANLRGFNQEGDVTLCSLIPPDKTPPPSYRYRLLSREELRMIWPEDCARADAEIDAFRRART